MVRLLTRLTRRFDRRELAAIYAGGVIGALARVGLAEALPHGVESWPWATFIVNMVGCALLGWFVYYNFLALDRSWLSQGKLDPRIGFWWVQIPAVLIAVYLIWRSDKLPKPNPTRLRVQPGAA